jgi:hypothetical protein
MIHLQKKLVVSKSVLELFSNKGVEQNFFDRFRVVDIDVEGLSYSE